MCNPMALLPKFRQVAISTLPHSRKRTSSAWNDRHREPLSTLQQLWHIPDPKLKPLSVITKTGPIGHMSPAWVSITQAGNSLPQLEQSKHCHITEASFLELKYAEALARAAKCFARVRQWPNLLPGRFTPFEERDICRPSAASTNRGKPVGSDSYTFCSEVFFACLFQMDTTR